jgi:hypothetical protein
VEFEACLVGSETVAILAEWDELKKKKRVQYLTPRLFRDT